MAESGAYTPDNLILNPPFDEPTRHWKYNPQTQSFDKEQGRRSAGYYLSHPNASAYDDPGEFHELNLVNNIRRRVNEWREEGWLGASSITKSLLRHWSNHNPGKQRPFFCQIEAIETLIWLVEAPEAWRQGIDIPRDGGPFQRICSKMATGTGKTMVMAMLIAWQTLNKSFNKNDKRFSRNFLIIAPNITVRNRLKELNPKNGDNTIYKNRDVNLLPDNLREKINQARVAIRNWHTLLWETEEKIQKGRSVDKRGAISDTAYAQDVLGDMAHAQNLIVINDEAHHAWREPAGKEKIDKDEKEEATVWMKGLDRIHKKCSISRCYDFSATPFVPGGKQAEDNLFKWIVSDFGLEDAIESGLVKIPRVVFKDDALPDSETLKSKFFHIYNDEDVKADLNSKADEKEHLPNLVGQAYIHLGQDWEEAPELLGAKGNRLPPVIISVVNRIETAARIEHKVKNDMLESEKLCNYKKTLRIDSDVVNKLDSKNNKKRELLESVGKEGGKGAHIHHVIAVGMLSEGWDTRTVTHIMGLRAFTSQLLCEQVVGRGLRRASYDINPEGYFDPEYVNVFGVPFTFLKRGRAGPPSCEKQKVIIQPVIEKARYEMRWPNVVRIERKLKARLKIDWKKVEPLILHKSETRKKVISAPAHEGKTDKKAATERGLEKITREGSVRKRAMQVAKAIVEQSKIRWQGSRPEFFRQAYQIAKIFIRRPEYITVKPEADNRNLMQRLLTITLNMQKVVNHISRYIEADNTYALLPVCDPDRPMLSTGDMNPWRTSRPCVRGEHCHINYTVCDGSWEHFAVDPLDKHPQITAWVKNDHLDFYILYMHQGAPRRYRPDFLIKFKSGNHLIIEIKGQKKDEDESKMHGLKQWVEAVNGASKSGHWYCAMAETPDEIYDILAKYASNPPSPSK